MDVDTASTLVLDFLTRSAYEKVQSCLRRYVVLPPFEDLIPLINSYGETQEELIATPTVIAGKSFWVSNVIRVYESTPEDVHAAIGAARLGDWGLERRSGIVVAGFESRTVAESALFLLQSKNISCVLNPEIAR